MRNLYKIGILGALALCAGWLSAQQPQTHTSPISALNAKWTNGVAPGYAITAGAGLVLNVGGGTANCGSGTIIQYAGGTLTMAASSTNRVYLNTSASCAPAVKTTAFAAADIPIATVVTSGSAITGITDVRTPFSVPPSSGGTAVLGPLQVPNLFTAAPTSQQISPFTMQANEVMDFNYAQFDDHTPYYCPGPAYCSTGVFIDDLMLACQGNPGKCSSDLLLNILTKWEGAWSNTLGYPIYLAPNFTPNTASYCSGFDNSCISGNGTTATGDGRIMLPQLIYLYCQKVGVGSAACTSAYSGSVAHIKAAWALTPRNGSTHLFTVPTGPGSGAASEYVCGTAFQEYMRLTGDVAGCNVEYAIVTADMQQLATAAGDTTNATFFAAENALVDAGIRSTLIDGSTGLLIAATLQNNANLDIPSSALAAYCDSSPVMAPCGVLTSGQKTAIATYFDTNRASLINANGYILQTPRSGGWQTIGLIPNTGGPPYTAGPYSATEYQGGFWTHHFTWFGAVLATQSALHATQMSAAFLSGVDPGCEYFNQGSGTCNGTTPNLESPQGAVALQNLFPAAPTFTAGIGCVNKYGAITQSTACRPTLYPFPTNHCLEISATSLDANCGSSTVVISGTVVLTMANGLADGQPMDISVCPTPSGPIAFTSNILGFPTTTPAGAHCVSAHIWWNPDVPGWQTTGSQNN